MIINTPDEIEALFPGSIPDGACPDDGGDFFCTRDAGHEPPHIAHGLDGVELARW